MGNKLLSLLVSSNELDSGNREEISNQYSFLLKGKACRVLQYQCMARPEMCFRFPDPTKVFAPVLNILL